MFTQRINSGLKGAADSGPEGLRLGLQTPLFIRNHSHSCILVFLYSGPRTPEGPRAAGTSPSSPSSRVLSPDGQPPDPLQRAAPSGGRGRCRDPPVRLHWSHWRWENRIQNKTSLFWNKLTNQSRSSETQWLSIETDFQVRLKSSKQTKLDSGSGLSGSGPVDQVSVCWTWTPGQIQ